MQQHQDFSQGWEESHRLKSRKKPPTSRKKGTNKTKNYKQTTLTHIFQGRGRDTDTRNENNQEPQTTRPYGIRYGDKKGPKGHNTLRIISQNINGIPVDAMDPKSLQIKQAIVAKDQHDIILWQETKMY